MGFPDPAGATHSTGPGGAVAAARWSGASRERRSATDGWDTVTMRGIVPNVAYRALIGILPVDRSRPGRTHGTRRGPAMAPASAPAWLASPAPDGRTLVLAPALRTQGAPEHRHMPSKVTVEVRDAVAWLTISNPPVNALTASLIGKISVALAAQQPPAVRVVIIRSASGERVFSAGHDVRELPRNGRDPLTYNDPLRKIIRQIETHPTPVIAMVEGSVWGGACELVLSCDLITASMESTFAITPARLGVPYNLSGTLNLMKVADMHFVKEMLFTARPIPAGRMAAYGVLNAVVPIEELEGTTADLAADIATGSPLVHQTMKEELRVLANAHPMTPEAHERIQSLRRAVYDSEDYQEGLRAFLEKRRPAFGGS